MKINYFKKQTNTVKLIILCLLIVTSLSTPTVHDVRAQNTPTNYTLLAPLPCIDSPDTQGVDATGKPITIPGIKCASGNGKIIETVNFEQYLQYAMNLIIALSAVAAVVMIVWGGFEYMLSTAISGKASGREKVEDAVKGLLLVLFSYLILQTIDPRLVQIPSTFVPKIDLGKDLLVDSNMTFLNQLQKKAAEYEKQKSEFADSLKQINTDITSLQNNYDNIQKLIDEQFAGENYDQTIVNSLLAQQQKIKDSINLKKSDFYVEEGRNNANNVIGNVLSYANNTQHNTEDTIININKNIVDIGTTTDLARKKLTDLGVYDSASFRSINDQANYTETTLNLIKIQKIATDTSDPFRIINPGADGIVYIERKTKTDGKNELQSFLDKQKLSVNNLKDEKLISDLKKQVDDTQKIIDNF